MDEQKRALASLYKCAFGNTGYTHKAVLRTIAELCLNKITRQEAAQYFLCWSTTEEETIRIRDKVLNNKDSKEACRFIKKYADAFQLEEHPITREWLAELEKYTRNQPKLKKDPDVRIPLRDIYWVSKKIMCYNYGKRRLYTGEDIRDMAYLRRAFMVATENTQTNHRKKSQKYTVSRDEDRNMFYVSAKGRLAQLPKYKLDKYRKQNIIVEDHGELRATCDICDGQYIKVGSFIQKHMKMLPKETKEALQKAFEEIRPCKMIIDTDFKKAYDPYYNNHQDTDGDKASNYSCMSGRGDSAQEFYGKIHGCKVVRFETDRGDQVGRCLMYEYNGHRHFIRIYGMYDYHRTMINLLMNEMKPEDLFGRNEIISGMKLTTDWTGEERTMYLDGNYYGISTDVDEDGTVKYYVGTSYSYDCKSTEGNTLEDSVEGRCCDRCGETCDQDECYYIGDNCYCCYECAENDGWRQCDHCGEWEREDEVIWCDNYCYCCSECCESAGGVCCDNCGEWHYEKSMIQVGDKWYCDDECAEEDGWTRCDYCNSWTHSNDDDTVETPENYTYCCKECAEKDGWELKDGEWKRVEDVEEVKEQEPETKELSNEG